MDVPAIDQQEQCSKQGLMGLRKLSTSQGPHSCDSKLEEVMNLAHLAHDAIMCEDLGTWRQEGPTRLMMFLGLDA